MIGKSIKKIVAICIALACYASAYVVWDGKSYNTTMYNNYSKQETFEISSASQLAGLYHVIEEDHRSFSGKTVVLTSDIFLNDTAGFLTKYYSYLKHWDPIGRKAFPFQGTFDGKGHTIYGLYSAIGNIGGNGLFGYTENAVIRNLNIKYARVSNGKTGVAGAVIGEGSSTIVHKILGEKIVV